MKILHRIGFFLVLTFSRLVLCYSFMYERQFVLNVAPKTVDCFYIEDVEEDNILSVRFEVLNSDSSGRPLGIGCRISAPTTETDGLIFARRYDQNGEMLDLPIRVAGDYELCFDNRLSYSQPKKVHVEIDIDGYINEESYLQKIFEYREELTKNLTEASKETIGKASRNLHKVRRTQWWMSNNIRIDELRMEKILSMINNQSLIHIVLVIGVSIVQVYSLKKLFNIKSSTSARA